MPHCDLCNSDKIDDLRYGKMIIKQRVSVHTFCLYLSSNLVQRGRDQSGICGFLIYDILAEVRRGRSMKCCYCGKRNATIGCCRQECMNTFHLGCGITNGALNQFVGTYKSFCDRHLPPMKMRPSASETCVICLEPMLTKSGFDPTKMIHSPCCNNGWYHKYCLQHYANTAGYFFKCPLCNSSTVFRDVLLWGIFVPNADAEWEKEPNAFRELLERDTICIAVECRNKLGRKSSITDLIYCTSCGSKPMHPECFDDNINKQPDDYICDVCNTVFNKSTVLTEPEITAPSSSQTSLTNSDLSDEEDPLDLDVFKPHACTNNSFRRPDALVSSDEEETDSDDPLTGDWDLFFKENSRNIINITTTEPTKPKEQQQQETNKRTKKENNQTESSIRQPLTSCTTNMQATKNEIQQNNTLRLGEPRTASDEKMVEEPKDEADTALFAIASIGSRLRRRQSCTDSNQKTNDFKEQKDDPDSALFAISSIGSRLRRRQSCTHSNQKPNDFKEQKDDPNSALFAISSIERGLRRRQSCTNSNQKPNDFKEQKDDPDSSLFAISSIGSRLRRRQSCTNSNQKTNDFKEQKDDPDSALFAISSIERGLRRRQSCTNSNQRSNDLQSGSIVSAHSWRSCTNFNAARSTSISSDTDDEVALKPSKPKRQRKTFHHNADISCIANRIRQRRPHINPESKFRSSTVNENNLNLAISSTNTSPKRYSDTGSTHDCTAKRTTASATITSQNDQNNGFQSSFLRDLTQAAINTATPLENNKINNLNENRPNSQDISCIGLRVHRRRTQSIQSGSEGSSSSGQGRLPKSRGN